MSEWKQYEVSIEMPLKEATNLKKEVQKKEKELFKKIKKDLFGGKKCK